MKVILLEDILGTGKAGDVATVANGYARNKLLPSGIAIEANAVNMKTLEHRRAKIAAKKAADKDVAEVLAKQLEGKTLEFTAKAGEAGKLFGSVTAAEIAEQIQEKLGFEIDKRKIDLNTPIKEIGTFDVAVKIYPEVAPLLKIIVNPEGGLPAADETVSTKADPDTDAVTDTDAPSSDDSSADLITASGEAGFGEGGSAPVGASLRTPDGGDA
ncbi:MAG: 50S ribosomal protein L9 [Clostridiales bacterium]|nr:50S ribosomal protein L9 [Clostridiales bacterium]